MLLSGVDTSAFPGPGPGMPLRRFNEGMIARWREGKGGPKVGGEEEEKKRVEEEEEVVDEAVDEEDDEEKPARTFDFKL